MFSTRNRGDKKVQHSKSYILSQNVETALDYLYREIEASERKIDDLEYRIDELENEGGLEK